MKLERNKDYIKFRIDNISVVFTTAEYERSFNRHTEDGIIQLNSLKDEFKLQKLLYLRQIHSDIIIKYDKEDREDFIENEGDAIITNNKKVGIGVFTADCVPVILLDKKKNVIAAIHSGWKGTLASITKKTIKEMRKSYGSEPKDIVAIIGAHIKQCCYEISEELKDEFLRKKSIESEELFKGRNLNMEICIKDDLLKSGVEESNIYSLDLCTHCSKGVKLFSYRRSKGTYGRLFSLIYID